MCQTLPIEQPEGNSQQYSITYDLTGFSMRSKDCRPQVRGVLHAEVLQALFTHVPTRDVQLASSPSSSVEETDQARGRWSGISRMPSQDTENELLLATDNIRDLLLGGPSEKYRAQKDTETGLPTSEPAHRDTGSNAAHHHTAISATHEVTVLRLDGASGSGMAAPRQLPCWKSPSAIHAMCMLSNGGASQASGFDTHSEKQMPRTSTNQCDQVQRSTCPPAYLEQFPGQGVEAVRCRPMVYLTSCGTPTQDDGLAGLDLCMDMDVHMDIKHNDHIRAWACLPPPSAHAGRHRSTEFVGGGHGEASMGPDLSVLISSVLNISTTDILHDMLSPDPDPAPATCRGAAMHLIPMCWPSYRGGARTGYDWGSPLDKVDSGLVDCSIATLLRVADIPQQINANRNK